MKLQKHLRVLVRIRDYETFQIEVGAEADYRDLGIADSDAAHMRPQERIKYTAELHTLVDQEVERLLLEDVKKVAKWSEIHPNLATDYLSTYLQRNHDARTEKDNPTPATGRRIRRRGPAETAAS